MPYPHKERTADEAPLCRRHVTTLRQFFERVPADTGMAFVVILHLSREHESRLAEVLGAKTRMPVAQVNESVRVEPNRGKGNAVRTGLLAARAPIALFSDADLSTPITEMPRLVAPIRTGQFDVVFGSRALDRKLIGTHQPWTREQSGRVFNFVMRTLTGLPFKDTQCGFKAFRMDVCRAVVEGALIDRFCFDVELLFIAHRAGLRMLEYPVRWDDVAGGSVSFRSGLQGFAELNEVRRNADRGLYDAAVARGREAAERVKNHRRLTEPSEVETDVSPELAGQRM